MKNIAIIHFQPVEKYPPVINLIDFISQTHPNQKVFVYTTWHNKDFKTYDCKSTNIAIKRFKSITSSSIISKILAYFFLYISILLNLIRIRPQAILYYETLSALPAILYCKISNVKIFIHYHEYTTQDEYLRGPVITKWIHKKEKQLYKKANWISHTNNKRLELFLQDENIKYNSQVHQTLPNYPSKHWADSFSVEENRNLKDVIKFIYIGSLGLNTMYIKEFANFIISQNGKATWDIYTNQFDDEALKFIKSLNSSFIHLNGAIDYYQIPEIIRKENYDVGLIIYNGHIKNYIYNAPNKLFEYLACNIAVWYPTIMVGCKEYKNLTSSPVVFEVAFTGNIEEALEKFVFIKNNAKNKFLNRYYCEDIYDNIVVHMIQ